MIRVVYVNELHWTWKDELGGGWERIKGGMYGEWEGTLERLLFRDRP